MPSTFALPSEPLSASATDTLSEVVETLAPLRRRAGSADERRAAEWIADRLGRAGVPAAVDEVPFRDGYAKLLLPLAAATATSGALALLSGRERHRALAAAVGAASAAAIVDDVSNGRRVWRRLITRPKPTWNVVAEAGDRAAPRTLVVLAHHDAAPTGRIFDQTLQRRFARLAPGIVARLDTSIPLWWPVAGAPAVLALGAAVGERRLLGADLALSLLTMAAGADIARSPVVPGANDNLSAVAALVALAERLRERPVQGLRVLLASCGAEEVLQGGVYGFVERHLSKLDRRHTAVLNLDTIGCPQLVMLEGEGPFAMRDYPGPSFRDLVARAARSAGAPLRRGVRSRASTDGEVTARAGYPTATIVSWEPDTKCQSNYHLMTDTPDRLRYDTVARAVDISEAVARELAACA